MCLKKENYRRKIVLAHLHGFVCFNILTNSSIQDFTSVLASYLSRYFSALFEFFQFRVIMRLSEHTRLLFAQNNANKQCIVYLLLW